MQALPKDLLVLAGAGNLPKIILQKARALGVERIGVLGVKGSTPRSMLALGDWSDYCSLSAIARFRTTLRECGFHNLILAGQVSPLTYFRAAFDPEIIKILRQVGIHNAHTIFHRLIEEIEAQGLSVLPSSLFLADQIPSPGLLTKGHPFSQEQMHDVEFGMNIAMNICELDIGQTVVVKDGVTLAVEGFEGTDSTILRGGRIARSGAMVIKVAKSNHDMRFDIPVVGLKTLRSMRRSHCSALAVQAGRTLFIDLPAVVREAERCGIAILAYDSKLPTAPTL